MKFIRKHINIIVTILVFILVVMGLLVLKEVFFPEENKAIYGTRLEGIEKFPINKEKKNQVIEIFKDISSSTKVRIAGRIIYVDVKTNNDVTRDTAKDYSNRVLGVFSDEERAYYDMQFLINNPENSAQFPIIGYKHHTQQDISWTKDR